MRLFLAVWLLMLIGILALSDPDAWNPPASKYWACGSMIILGVVGLYAIGRVSNQ